jgi:disulfide bond formation protein DsbB
MPPLPSPRLTNLGLFLLALSSMVVALFLQHFVHLEPCPLCIFQRIAVMVAGAVALLAALHNPAALGRRIYAGLTLLGTLAGIAVAGRHVWLQHLPADEVPECGPGLNYWVQNFPLTSVIQKVFRGSGECAKVDWTFLGFSLPELTLALFTGMTVVVLWQLFRRDPR